MPGLPDRWRFEMEQLSAIVLIDRDDQMIVGYKGLGPDEFWTRGHMPDHPLLPGVLMCEAATQLCSYYTVTQGIVRDGLVGFGGMENVRLRWQCGPGISGADRQGLSSR